jgi:hypothetical protein
MNTQVLASGTDQALRLRGLVAAAVLGSAVVHAMLYADGASGIAVIGPLFLLNAVGGLLIAVLLPLWQHWLPVLAAVGFGLLSLVALLWSAAFGLFGVNEPLDELPQLISIVTEALATILGVWILRLESRSS